MLIDAICQITGTTEKYSSAIPEPYTFLPEGHRSIALPDGSITSPFLEEFGRPPRDTGLESERNNRISAAQRLNMLNSSHIQRKLEQGPRLQELLAARQEPRPLIETLYLTILSRYPTDAKTRLLCGISMTISWPVARRSSIWPGRWSISAEFMYRH